jgi:cell wall-associated NlpC family hydrolase
VATSSAPRTAWQHLSGSVLRATSLIAAVVTAAVLASAGGLLVPPSAAADPQYPGVGRVEQARAAASAKAAELGRIRSALAAGTARLEAARLAAEQAAEAYDAAAIELARRSTAATVAAANSDRAATVFHQSQAAVGRLAAQTYQDGGEPSLANAVFASDGLQDLLDRSTMLTVVGGARVRTMKQLNSSRTFATWVQQQADAALHQQQNATAALDAAQSTARRTADDAAASMVSTEGEQRSLTAQLAGLKATSNALQQQWQAGLAIEAAARDRARATAALESQARRSRHRARSANDPGLAPGGDGDSGAVSGSAEGTAASGLAAVAWARQRLGLPYQWGGAGPDSYDCSGLTMRAWEQAGVKLPHYAASQYARGAHVPYGSIRPGDLIFYATDTGDASSIHHVTMYVGGGMMIEAPYTGANVRIVPVRWNQAMPRAGRP